MSHLKETIIADMKAAMRAHNSDQLSVIRMLLAAIKQVEVDERIELDDARIMEVVTKMIKQRRDSEQIYRQANRVEMADREAAEISELQKYLPQPLSENELLAAIDETLARHPHAGMADMGKIMAELKTALAMRADMGQVSRLVKQQLAK